jgi:hypothetical protein
MKKVLIYSLLLVGGLMVSCTPNVSSHTHSSGTSGTILEESILTESTISESTISEDVIEEEPADDLGIWLEAYDLMREPTAEELALAPTINIAPGRFEYVPLREEEKFVTSFDHMVDGSFNGFTSTSEDPESRGYAVIIYYDGEFRSSSGIGLGLMAYSSYASNMELASKVITADIYINYSITDINTSDVNDIVTIRVATFTFQNALITRVN